MNLLEHFTLQHVQVSLLEAKLEKPARGQGNTEAKVEMSLAPRALETDSGDKLPAYQVSARLSCRGGDAKQEGEPPGPKFNVVVGFEAIYQQTDGEPVDVAEFSSHHASLARQLYPLLQQEMRMLLLRMGLEHVKLPFDLSPRIQTLEEQSLDVSGAVH